MCARSCFVSPYSRPCICHFDISSNAGQIGCRGPTCQTGGGNPCRQSNTCIVSHVRQPEGNNLLRHSLYASCHKSGNVSKLAAIFLTESVAVGRCSAKRRLPGCPSPCQGIPLIGLEPGFTEDGRIAWVQRHRNTQEVITLP